MQQTHDFVCTFLLATLAAACITSVAAGQDKLTFFDGTRYTNAPQDGWIPRRVQINTSWSLGGKRFEEKIATARQIGAIVNLDIENSNLNDDRLHLIERKYGRPLTSKELQLWRVLAVQRVRAVDPTLRVGCYWPHKEPVDIYVHDDGVSGYTDEFGNTASTSLDRAVDFLILGCFKSRAERSLRRWRAVRITKLKQARKQWSMPLYASLNAHFLQGPKANQWIPQEEFQAMVDSVRPWCNGIIVFGREQESWSEEMPWVKVIRRERERK